MRLTIQINEDGRGGFIASCPSLPGCKCKADTREQAKKKLAEAVCGYISAIRDCTPETIARDLVEA